MHNPPLTPTQQQAFDGLTSALDLGLSANLWGSSGLGKTTVLRAIHHARGGAFLGATQFVAAMDGKHPLGIEEALFRLLADAVRSHDLVIVDDLERGAQALSGGCGSYPRANWTETVFEALVALAHELKTTLLTGSCWISQSLENTSISFGIQRSEREVVHNQLSSVDALVAHLLKLAGNH